MPASIASKRSEISPSSSIRSVSPDTVAARAGLSAVRNSCIDPFTGGNSRRLQPGACRSGRAVIVNVVDPFEMLWEFHVVSSCDASKPRRRNRFAASVVVTTGRAWSVLVGLQIPMVTVQVRQHDRVDRR